MGRGNSPRARQARHLQRRQGQRASHDRILIVSEGRRTEPNYFTEIRTAYRLHTANVKVLHSRLGTSPLQVVRYVEQLFIEGDTHARLVPRAFDRVFAVFDRDEHESYTNALHAAASLDGKLRNDNKQPVEFSAVASIPCFELWLLLHFEHIQSPIDRHEALQVDKSVADHRTCLFPAQPLSCARYFSIRTRPHRTIFPTRTKHVKRNRKTVMATCHQHKRPESIFDRR